MGQRPEVQNRTLYRAVHIQQRIVWGRFRKKTHKARHCRGMARERVMSEDERASGHGIQTRGREGRQDLKTVILATLKHIGYATSDHHCKLIQQS